MLLLKVQDQGSILTCARGVMSTGPTHHNKILCVCIECFAAIIVCIL